MTSVAHQYSAMNDTNSTGNVSEPTDVRIEQTDIQAEWTDILSQWIGLPHQSGLQALMRNDLLLAGIFFLLLALIWTIQAGIQLDSTRRKRQTTRRWSLGLESPADTNRAKMDKGKDTALCVLGRCPLSGLLIGILACAALGYSLRQVFYAGGDTKTWYVQLATKYGFFTAAGLSEMLDTVDACAYPPGPGVLVTTVAFIIEAVSTVGYPWWPSTSITEHLTTFLAVCCAVVVAVEIGRSAPGPALRLVRCFLVALLGSWYLRMAVVTDGCCEYNVSWAVTVFSWHAAVVMVAVPCLAGAVAYLVAFCRHRRYLAWRNEDAAPKAEDGKRCLLPRDEWAD